MKIFIANTHSVLNCGDAGIVLSQLEFLHNRFPDAKISLVSRTPEIDRPFYHSRGIKVFTPFFRVPSLASGFRKKAALSLRGLLDFSAQHALSNEIKNSDLVISSGGGYFWSHRRHFTGPMFYQNYLPIKFALKNRKPVVFFPQSYGPFLHRPDELRLKHLLENECVMKIFSREMRSFRYLNTLLENNLDKLELCPDMAFKLNPGAVPNDARREVSMEHPIAAITLRQWDYPGSNSLREKRDAEDRYLTELLGFCRTFHRHTKGSVVLFSQSRGPGDIENDRVITQRFRKRLRGALPDKNLMSIDLEDIASPADVMQILKQVDFLIATRFHSAIFAFITGIPAVSIAYQSKGHEIMKLLDLSEYSLDITDFTAERLWRLSQQILENTPLLRQKIRRRAASLRSELEAKLDQAFDEIPGLRFS